MRKKGVLIAAHRGSSGGNIPCNTLAAFDAAIMQGAQIIETDVTRSADGELFVFHPRQEPNHLGKNIHLEEMTAEEIKRERYVNFDNNPTEYPVCTLDGALEHLKERCVINLDHCWNYLGDVMKCVSRHGMKDQIIIKTPAKPEHIEAAAQTIGDYMYMPIFSDIDELTPLIEKSGLNYIGAELIFKADNSPITDDEYIKMHHDRGRLLWANSIIYDYRAVLSAGHSDDAAVAGNPDFGWGRLIDKGFDIIQTDWVSALSLYIKDK